MITILYNAAIFTLDPKRPTASAIAIDGERIFMLGDNQGVSQSLAGDKQHREIIDAGGKAVIPGLIDAHIHLEQYALNQQKVDCETTTRRECIQRVAQRALQTPAGQWILGHGWNQNDWSEGFGSATDLDAVAPHHPVFLTAKSLHAVWVNTAALEAANIDARTPDPPGGQIGRDERGSPNGILFEAAMTLAQSALPEPTSSQVEQAIRECLPRLAKMGLTGLHDFDRRRCFAALQTLHKQEALSLRVVKSIPLEDLPHAIALGLQSGFGDDRLRIGGVKAFADGALGPRTAAMLQPYEGEPENRGILLLDSEELYEQGRQAIDSGLSLAVHAIGDRANHEVLNAFDQLRRYESEHRRGKLRHRIEHVQLIHPDDVDRLAGLGIVASMQPIHATSDMYMADRYWGDRSAYAYAWRKQLDAGALLAFGSDAPVESPNPFWGLHAAVTRRRADGSPGADGWYPDQKLNMYEALAGFTKGPAYLAGMEDRLGRLSPGYLADLLVLPLNPFQCHPDEIKDIQPLATMVGGQWTFNELEV
jgi:hypothetical protein